MQLSNTQEEFTLNLTRVMNLPEGQNLLADILDDLGIGKELDPTAERVALYNVGQMLLQKMYEANYPVAAQITALLHTPLTIQVPPPANHKEM